MNVARSTSYRVYISQLTRFARVSSHVDNFNSRYKVLKIIINFVRRFFDLVSKYNVGLKTLPLKGLSEPEFYGVLVYKLRK